MNLDETAKEAWQNAESKGWHEQPRTFGDLIALIHSEASEALEAYRRKGHERWSQENGKPEGTMSELADIVYRVMDTAESLWRAGEVDQTLSEAMAEKLRYNRTRPHRHGGKRL